MKPSRGALQRLRHDAGQGLAEYALILGLVAVATIAALLFLGGGIQKTLSAVGNVL